MRTRAELLWALSGSLAALLLAALKSAARGAASGSSPGVGVFGRMHRVDRGVGEWRAWPWR
jgi:hypothetical protein